MSEDRDDSAPEEIDLTGVPMDDDEATAAEQDGGGEKKPEEEKPAEKAPLAADELEKRFSSTKVALATERARRRELERTVAEMRAGQTPAARQPVREEPEAEIDPDVDPIGAMKQMRAKIKAYETADRLDRETDQQREAKDRQLSSVERELSEHEVDFREDHPDYDDAAKHYAVTRAQELMSFGLTPDKIQPMLREEFATLAQTAIRAGKNPAAVVYEMAKGRGFGAKKADDPKPDPKPADKGVDKGKLEALKRGAAAGSPLGGSGGRAASGLDAATVANINIRDKKGGEAFDKAWEAMEREAKRAERAR